MFQRLFGVILPAFLLVSCGKSDLSPRKVNAVAVNQPATATTSTTATTATSAATSTAFALYTSQIGREKGHEPLAYWQEESYSLNNNLITYAAHNIPLVEMHDEGLDSTSVVIKQSRIAIPCGIGTLTTTYQAVQDCEKKNSTVWSAKNNSLNGEGDWKLVARTESGKEVWADQKTGLLWSDVLVSTGNWCQASGNQQNSNGINCAVLATEKFCQDKMLLDAKGNLDDKLVDWRIPTRNDYLQADVNGLRFVVPNANQAFWTATINSMNRAEAWTYHGGTGLLQSLGRAQLQAIRCVGRVIKI